MSSFVSCDHFHTGCGTVQISQHTLLVRIKNCFQKIPFLFYLSSSLIVDCLWHVHCTGLPTFDFSNPECPPSHSICHYQFTLSTLLYVMNIIVGFMLHTTTLLLFHRLLTQLFALFYFYGHSIKLIYSQLFEFSVPKTGTFSKVDIYTLFSDNLGSIQEMGCMRLIEGLSTRISDGW